MALLPKFVRYRIGRPFIRAADGHRDRFEWIDAVVHYRRALAWMPWREDLKVQIGNCLKEVGDHRGAAAVYRSVAEGPHRAEAVRQLADANRRAGVSVLPFIVAESPLPGSHDGARTVLPPLSARLFPNRLRVEAVEPRRWLGEMGRPPRERAAKPPAEHPAILLDQVGALTMTRDGVTEPLFAGVVAVRARVFSTARLDRVELWLGEGGARTRIASATTMSVPRADASIALYVVNAWIDSGQLPAGRHWLALRTPDPSLSTGLFVNVAAGDHTGLDLASSNTFVPSPEGGGIDPAAAIIAAPAVSRPAVRGLFDRPIGSILAMRVDQLGDVAASLPAMARLRALFPEATLTILVQPAVRAIVEASGLADRVMTVALTYDEASGVYHLPTAAEERLAAAFGTACFDLAIDLCSAPQTRPLLLLTGATHLAGFNPGLFPFLDYGLDVRSRDKANQLDRISHAASVLTLVEGLAIAAAGGREPIPRIAASDDHLARYGLAPQRYVVIHTGARHAINRWPLERFRALAERLLVESDLQLVMFCDDPQPEIVGGDRLTVLGTIDGDAFDAILAGARVFVGNDSGPKHLAAARGVPTVSIHVDRLNWNEWGQEGRGTILSKRVPCAGCGLNDVWLCGREAVCIRSITVDEVMVAVREYL